MMFRKPGQKILKLCTLLGNEYHIETLDFENVISRSYGNGFKIVISDVDNNFKYYCVTVTIWNTTKDLIADAFYNVISATEIKKLVNSCAEKYSNLVQDINGNILV